LKISLSFNLLDDIKTSEVLSATTIDFVHLDLISKINVPQLKKIYSINKYKKIDFHINSSKWFEIINEIHLLSTENLISIQIDEFSNSSFEKLMKFCKKKSLKIGFACSTEFDFINFNFNKYRDILKFILVSTSKPSITGAPFNFNSIKFINHLNNNFNFEVHADGGINEKNVSILSLLNINVIVLGSFFNNFPNPADGVNFLNKNFSNIKIKDLISDCFPPPSVRPSTNLLTILKKIDDGGIGFVLVQDSNKVYGIISDGDIRRFILKNGADNISNVKAKKIMYKNPLIFEKNEIGIIVQYFLSENRMNQLLIRNFDNSILVLPINSIIKNLL
jgi:pentose-5-phosphate-3-epimerase/predicted transcriptional regulator